MSQVVLAESICRDYASMSTTHWGRAVRDAIKSMESEERYGALLDIDSAFIERYISLKSSFGTRIRYVVEGDADDVTIALWSRNYVRRQRMAERRHELLSWIINHR